LTPIEDRGLVTGLKRKKMPSKGSPSKAKGPSKREILDGVPGDKAAQIIANAKAKGITVSDSYAYALAAKRREKAPKVAEKTVIAAKPNAQRKTAAKATAVKGNAAPNSNGVHIRGEKDFLALAVDLGLRRSQELLDRLKSSVSNLSRS
jgi:hypothetical protein